MGQNKFLRLVRTVDATVDKIIGTATVAKAAPLPWRVGEHGAVVDANGDPVIYVAARLNIDGSWLDIAAELAAAHEMREALVLYEQAYEALANWGFGRADRLFQDAHAKRKAALAKARGEQS
jgi:hypothetical protein